MLYGR